MPSVTIHVQFEKGGSTRAGLSVELSGHGRKSTNNQGNVTFTDLRERTKYTAYHDSYSVTFTAGESPVTLTIR